MKSEDEEYLKLLGSAHRILGAITALVACFVLVLLIDIEYDAVRSGSTEGLFGLLLLIPTVFLFSMAAAMFLVARSLVEVKNYAFIRSIGFLECVFLFPFGAILGVLTLVTISKESVRGLFNSKSPTPPPLPGKDVEQWEY